jgi:hypothetical protein
MAVFTEVNSDPQVTVCTIDSFLECQSMGVLSMQFKISGAALPAHMLWHRFSSLQVVVQMLFLHEMEQFSGSASLTFSSTDLNQS